MTASGNDRDTRLDITDVLIRYATAIDTRDWTLFRTCFTDDCRADYGRIGSWHGAEEFTAFMRQVHDLCGPSLHRITNQVVSGGHPRVTARSYVDALVMMPDNINGTRASGYYDDELVHTEDGWKIARRRHVTIHLTALEPSVHRADH